MTSSVNSILLSLWNTAKVPHKRKNSEKLKDHYLYSLWGKASENKIWAGSLGTLLSPWDKACISMWSTWWVFIAGFIQTPLIKGLFFLLWHLRQKDLKSSTASLVMFAYLENVIYKMITTTIACSNTHSSDNITHLQCSHNIWEILL